MSIEEAFKQRISPLKQITKPESENATEPPKNKETVDVQKDNAEEYTEFPLYTLAQDGIFTAVPTGTQRLLLMTL